MASVQCPICNAFFPSSSIEMHVNSCLIGLTSEVNRDFNIRGVPPLERRERFNLRRGTGLRGSRSSDYILGETTLEQNKMTTQFKAILAITIISCEGIDTVASYLHRAGLRALLVKLGIRGAEIAKKSVRNRLQVLNK
jgi:hypothetical protein